jgi:deoxycytidylate deaminase
VGFTLYTNCVNHFVNYLGQIGLSLGYDSCCAAVAINAHAQYDQTALGFSMVYGSSRLFKGLDPSVPAGPMAAGRTFSSSLLQEHAEQTAILTAVGQGLPFWADPFGVSHIYVDFNPCPGCFPWLNARAENWWVHYHTNLAAKRREITKEKKDTRKVMFGRITEPNGKRLRVG